MIGPGAGMVQPAAGVLLLRRALAGHLRQAACVLSLHPRPYIRFLRL